VVEEPEAITPLDGPMLPLDGAPLPEESDEPAP
jgi:hypothetical protein